MDEPVQNEPAEVVQSGAGKKKPRGAAFQKGHDPRRHVPGKAPGVPQDVNGGSGLAPVPDVDPSDLYAAMRAILDPVGKPRTPLERACKKALLENPKWFIDRYADVQPKGVEGGRETEEDVRGPQQERVEALLDRLLAEGEASGWKM